MARHSGIAAALIVSVLLLFVPKPADSGKLDIIVNVVELIKFGIELLGRPSDTSTRLPDNTPGVDFGDQVVEPDHLNVGERARVSVEFFVSYGCADGKGEGEIKLFRDGRQINANDERRKFKQKSSMPFERRVVDLSVLAIHPGESRLHLEIEIVGYERSWMRTCFQVSKKFEGVDRSLTVSEPYEIEVSDPSPREVKPGQTAKATLSVKVKTTSKGRLISGSFAREDIPPRDVPGRSYITEEKRVPLAERSLGIPGCEYDQDTTPDQLLFPVDRIHIRVFLKDWGEGRYYDFKRGASELPQPVVATSRPVFPYQCPAQFDTASCRCLVEKVAESDHRSTDGRTENPEDASSFSPKQDPREPAPQPIPPKVNTKPAEPDRGEPPVILPAPPVAGESPIPGPQKDKETVPVQPFSIQSPSFILAGERASVLGGPFNCQDRWAIWLRGHALEVIDCSTHRLGFRGPEDIPPGTRAPLFVSSGAVGGQSPTETTVIQFEASWARLGANGSPVALRVKIRGTSEPLRVRLSGEAVSYCLASDGSSDREEVTCGGVVNELVLVCKVRERKTAQLGIRLVEGEDAGLARSLQRVP